MSAEQMLAIVWMLLLLGLFIYVYVGYKFDQLDRKIVALLKKRADSTSTQSWPWPS